MNSRNRFGWVVLAAGLVTGGVWSIDSASAGEVLFDFDRGFDPAGVEARDVKLSKVKRPAGSALRIESFHHEEWPGITLKPPGKCWDLSRSRGIKFDVHNTGSNKLQVGFRIDNPGGDGSKNCIQKIFGLDPGEQRTLEIPFHQRLPEGTKLFGMRGYPGGAREGWSSIDPANFIQLFVFVPRPSADHVFEVDNIRAYGSFTLPEWKDNFFPFIDEFGQYLHKDWPGKVHSVRDLVARRKREARELKAQPGPEGWNRYGGWRKGPTLKATGYFYPVKHEGKWWLVDPEGKLFFTHGIDCVGSWATTPIDEREHWFKDFPGHDERFKEFHGRTGNVVHGYYKGKNPMWFNFGGANVMRKYGDDWQRSFAELAHVRLRSWGMNTVGNWSSSAVYLMRKTPYVVAVHFGGKVLAGSEGYWGQFRDVFDPDFKSQVRKRMAAEKEKTAGDPWCIGYFLDNEISWGDDMSLAVAALTSPPEQIAKQVFIEDLRARYGSIKRLNAAWGEDHRSWEALLASREGPDKEKAREDLTAFYTKTAETYFKVCREAVREVAPNNLYLGCRFAWVNDLAFQSALKYCDVVSYNLYWRSVDGFKLPGGADYPVIIGEWHFGALDRGQLHPGLVEVKNQDERAAAYKNYVTGALRNPLFVGCHWFQYMDEATTGRPLDGENYQVGFVDIANTPYPETVAACRDIGYGLYATRSKAD